MDFMAEGGPATASPIAEVKRAMGNENTAVVAMIREGGVEKPCRGQSCAAGTEKPAR
jgi:hypothetical protein